MSLQKKHSKNTYESAKRTDRIRQKRKRQVCRLCIKCALWTSAFTFTLLAAEWNILKPQPDSWKQHSKDTMAKFLSDASGTASSVTKAADSQLQAIKDHSQSSPQKNNAAGRPAPAENSSITPPDSHEHPNAPASAENTPNDPAQEKDTGKDGSVPFSDPDTAGQNQTANTDEQTRYPAGNDGDSQIYYSYAENPGQFSADNGRQIQSVPECLPAGQLIDTTADDETPHVTQVSSDWNLILVNPWNEVPDGYEISLTNLSNGHSIDSRCYPALTEMMNACRGAGLHPLICSSYRTWEKQESLFQERIDELRAQGYSKKDARTIAATSVARPGTSEHQIGLAVDIVDQSHQTLDAMQEDTPVQQWLMENSWKYGFILRYPNDKSRLTGIIYEPWHYRYVGLEAAQEIYERGICLEEYLEELS